VPSASEEFIAQIRKLRSHAAIMRLWRQVERGEPVPGWPPGIAFEYLILRAFEIERADVTWPYEVPLEETVVEQIDGAVHLPRLSCLLEAKDQVGPINAEPIAKLRDKLLRRPPVVIGAVFSKTGFTAPATILTRYMAPQRILLWEGPELTLALERKDMAGGLLRKFRFAVEHGRPDYNLRQEEAR
jgi:hypothetical protein